MTAFFGILTLVLAALLIAVGAFYLQARNDMKLAQEETENIRKKAKSALARYKSIADLEEYKADTQKQAEEQKAELSRMQDEQRRAEAEWDEKVVAHEAHLNEIIAQSESVEETLDMQSFGFYRPKYDFEDSEHYSHRLKAARDDQKALVKSEDATHCPQSWTVDGSAAKGRTMIKEHAKLMLRAFNGECDAAIAKAKYNNVNNLENRMNKSFEAINKLGESKQLWITHDYLNLKLQELHLVHEHREKVQEEREEQRRIKEQMREEEKAVREIEKAKKDAEKEEESKTSALEKAREELAAAHGKQTDRLQAIVDKLEAELKDALERKAKAIARAQLTRSGHVYVLSNVGSFGESVYKIGMTRRLEPLERVKELGDASVPFPFDVHAMIYSEDAPALEKKLHDHFASRRVNMVNLRREYFRVSLDEVRDAVTQNFGQITFVTVPEAEEYRKTVAMLDAPAVADQRPTLTQAS